MVRRNTAMRGTDEIRFYSWAHTLGGIATAVICLAALLLAYNSPLGAAAGNPILQDRTTGQLFVDINQITHPGSQSHLGAADHRPRRVPAGGQVQRIVGAPAWGDGGYPRRPL